MGVEINGPDDNVAFVLKFLFNKLMMEVDR
jgi:hypothetical protein